MCQGIGRVAGQDVIINYKNPSLNERINLLKLNLSKTEMDKPINISYIADITDGFSPAQIVEVIKRSYIIAGEREGNTIRQDDLVSSVAQLKEQPKVLGFKKIDGQTE